MFHCSSLFVFLSAHDALPNASCTYERNVPLLRSLKKIRRNMDIFLNPNQLNYPSLAKWIFLNRFENRRHPCAVGRLRDQEQDVVTWNSIWGFGHEAKKYRSENTCVLSTEIFLGIQYYLELLPQNQSLWCWGLRNIFLSRQTHFCRLFSCEIPFPLHRLIDMLHVRLLLQ